MGYGHFRWQWAGRVAQRYLTFICNFLDVYKENVFLNIQVIETIFFLMDGVWRICYRDRTLNFHRYKAQWYKCVT